MKTILQSTTCLLTILTLIMTSHAQPPTKLQSVVDDRFENSPLDRKVWKSGVGDWKVSDGVLKGAERAKDKHAAALRRVIETQDAVYQLRFRLTGEAKAFHFGFDPAKGELTKKGHLFSVIVTPDSWKIMKHADKNDPKANPNKNLAVAKMAFRTGQWYSLKVTTSKQEVVAEIDGKMTLKAADSTFGVRKPTLVFRCVGNGVEIDDLKVSRRNK